MSTTTIVLVVVIAGYIGALGFILCVLSVAARADRAAEDHARVLAARRDRLERWEAHPLAVVTTADDAGRRHGDRPAA